MQNMRWNLERVLFWWSLLAALFLALTLVNFLWPFANSPQPANRLYIGLMVGVCNLSFSVIGYFLVRAKHLKVSLAVVAGWVLAKLLYGATVIMIEPFSGWTVGILLGELFQCALLIYFSLSEARSNGIFRGASA